MTLPEARVFLRIVVIGCLITTGVQTLLQGAKPPYGRPIGIKQWAELGGKGVPGYWFRADQRGLQIAMTTPSGRFPGLQGVAASPDDKARCRLTIAYGGTYPMSSSLHTPSGYSFDLPKNSVFPLFGELYHVSFGNRDAVKLTRVTNLVPAETRPAISSRTISSSEYDATLFWREDTQYNDLKFFDLVGLDKFDDSLLAGDLHLTPRMVSRKNYGPQPIAPETHRVKKGELLTARGRSYKVLNVVPPQTITNVGKLVGWIELAADPEKEPAK